MSVFSGETPFVRTNSLSMAFPPGNRGLAGQTRTNVGFSEPLVDRGQTALFVRYRPYLPDKVLKSGIMSVEMGFGRTKNIR